MSNRDAKKFNSKVPRKSVFMLILIWGFPIDFTINQWFNNFSIQKTVRHRALARAGWGVTQGQGPRARAKTLWRTVFRIEKLLTRWLNDWLRNRKEQLMSKDMWVFPFCWKKWQKMKNAKIQNFKKYMFFLIILRAFQNICPFQIIDIN